MVKFNEVYTSTAKAEVGKTSISNESYAICELLEKILDKLEQGRKYGSNLLR